MASLAGSLFNNKDDKVGQQDTHQQFFESREQRVPRFPDTSNTRYQSHCAAAAELITRLDLYVEYLAWIRDGKERPGFTNLEQNVFEGLQDVPTQVELAVLTLYAETIGHPYMRVVRGPGTEQVNMLELGPLHFKVKAHIQRTIEDPDILLNQDAGYEFGSMDGKPWHTPEATKAVLKLSPSLPHLKPVLVAFFKGALTTWEHFTSEFEEGGLIHSTTAEERDRAWMPPTNDVNEGALGAFCSYIQKKPNTTMLQYNALAKFKFNHTAAFVHQEFNSDDYAFVHKLA